MKNTIDLNGPTDDDLDIDGDPEEIDGEPNWKVRCQICGQKPTVGNTHLCGPCCFGEADTAGGNW